MSAPQNPSFPIAESRAIVSDLLKPDPLIYWVDFLISLTIAYGFAIAYLRAPLVLWQQIICLVISGFALHRVANFIHEIVHLHSKRTCRSFQIGWNILAGIPMLMPSFFFDTHMSHHKTDRFGTRRDCDYIPLGRGPLRNIVFFMCQLFLQPVFVMVRFVLVTPISFLHPKLRVWVLENFSSFVFVFPCPREIPKNAPRAAWAMMDIACCLRATAILVWVGMGWAPWTRILQLYSLALFPLGLHYLRSLTAHNYLSNGQPMSFRDQLFDSIDIQGDRFFTELFYPVGLRYHALHHLFPSMPYHNLALAHRRLLAQLPEDAPYRQLVYPSFWSVMKELLQNARSPIQHAHGRVVPRDDSNPPSRKSSRGANAAKLMQ